MNIPKNPGLTVTGQKPGIAYNTKNLSPRSPLLDTTVPSLSATDDTVSISDEAISLFYNHKKTTPYDEKYQEISRLLRELNEASDNDDNPYDEKLKCIIIASRIMNGDKVPIKDMKFLAEKEPGMYSNAILLRRQNEKPKKYNSLLKDEEDDVVEEQTSTDSSGGVSPPVPEEIASVESGGEAESPE